MNTKKRWGFGPAEIRGPGSGFFVCGVAMSDDLTALREETDAALRDAADLRAWDAVRVGVLGKSGKLTALLKTLGQATPEERKERGAALNRLKEALSEAIEARRVELESAALEARLTAERIDITRPPRPRLTGAIHPISRTIEEMTAIFGAMGFSVAEGPDVEGDWHNFGALNIPAHHPARADHDTFYLPSEQEGAAPRVLRTHTSPVQIRTMLNAEPPIRIIAPGRTYRADHDATHSPMFHQCEGLVIGRGITLGHLKGTLIDFLRAFFGVPGLPVRFRASYFPFTEPSMEVDIGWNRKTGELGGGGDWLEILGSGMVQPKVLANCGIDPREWQGFAFGMGVERVTMLKHGIADLRPFYDSDLRWLRHYGFNPLAPVSLHEGV
ncbi:Phenylalanyl-tRNA synthetase alpha chain [Granulibacter bethesdensis]|uniref:Phenylalanine--tRNA ligase alpha subunit n=2 Tax=Granulibacter bethesdensis TaxID=364410 RepID=Q0BRZ9_GRABC|nr:Phenylalanyl-tRNA synthetase alpha chain [Granulibacter bethesdensis CGDNIH1]AHJ68668.1 Phenylalanyl-tRNA synthetase alpha chain [Granulibacter bethesdensis]APH52236.1 Phenylalanyl-tRNA synthetase alpha chain [Granulibacter bethesdensis]APH64929.1 Phenylalanyl-tRNA synthetase alpha chain [Granulibacter bethesdensis]